MVDHKENQPKKINIWLPLLLALVMVGGMLIGNGMQKAPVIKISSNDKLELGTVRESGRVEELIRYIDSRYVDDIDRDKLIEKAISNVLGDLDPHSNYISAKELKAVNEQLDGNFEGVGIEFLIVEDTIVVVAPIVGGPSEKAGIMAGDKIVQIGDSTVAGQTYATSDVVKQLKGEKGTTVKVGVLRGKTRELLSFDITRDQIPLNSLEVAYMLDEKTGYLKLNRFSSTTYKEFMASIEDLVDNEQMEDLVLDLRQNPGGYLLEATKMLSQLVEDVDKLIVYTEGRTTKRSEYKTTGKTFYKIGKVAVLIDEGSASASEIVAGAIQDWDRGIIVGRRSFGKGLVQEQYDLKDGSALRLTVARYFTPSGRCIQKSYDDLSAYDNDVVTRFNNGELINGDSLVRTDSDTTAFYTEDGRVVYGGGGISPDFFVPIDTTTFDDYYIQLKALSSQFVYRYSSDHPSEFNYENLNTFKSKYRVGDDVLEAFKNYAIKKDIAYDAKGFADSKSRISQLLKARFARQLFREKGFYSVWNEIDPVVMKAMELLKEDNPLSALKNQTEN